MTTFHNIWQECSEQEHWRVALITVDARCRTETCGSMLNCTESRYVIYLASRFDQLSSWHIIIKSGSWVLTTWHPTSKWMAANFSNLTQHARYLRNIEKFRCYFVYVVKTVKITWVIIVYLYILFATELRYKKHTARDFIYNGYIM